MMSTIDLISLVASLVGMIVGILAIWLSIQFYRMSTAASESARDAAKDIDASVRRLEELFRLLYSDTFSMVRENMTVMQRHIWPEDAHSEEQTLLQIEKKADEKVLELKKEIEEELMRVLQTQDRTTDERIAQTHQQVQQLQALFSRAISEAREVEEEAREETARQSIVEELWSLRGKASSVEAHELVDRVTDKLGLPSAEIREELEKMKAEGLVEWEGDTLAPNSEVKVE